MSPPARALYVAEPRGMWLQRQPVVADCSVLCAFLFAEHNGDEAAAMLVGRAVHAPTLLQYEMASVSRKKLIGGATPHAVDTALADFDEQRIELHTVPASAALRLATRYVLNTYDAAYLWLAAELQAPLATFDRQLARAAQQHLGTGGG